ncbi:putative phage tail fiber protein [Salmonella phage SPFM12]|nr:putative phage tail fiber protein [Salmonella phage SPFM12]
MFAKLFERLDRMIGLQEMSWFNTMHAAGRVINKGKNAAKSAGARCGLSGRKVYGDAKDDLETARGLAGRDDDVAEFYRSHLNAKVLDGYRGARHDIATRYEVERRRGRDRLRGWFSGFRGRAGDTKSSLSERFGGRWSRTKAFFEGVGGGGSTIGRAVRGAYDRVLNQRLPGDPEDESWTEEMEISLFSSTGKKTNHILIRIYKLTDNPLTRWWKGRKDGGGGGCLPGKVLGFAKRGVDRLKDMNEIPEGEEKTRLQKAFNRVTILDFLSPKAGSIVGKIKDWLKGLASKIGLGFNKVAKLPKRYLAAAGKLRYYKGGKIQALTHIKLGSDIVDSAGNLILAAAEAGEYYQVIDGKMVQLKTLDVGIRDVYDDHGNVVLQGARLVISGSVRGGFEAVSSFGKGLRKVAGMGGGEGPGFLTRMRGPKRGVKGAWNKLNQFGGWARGLIRRWGGVLFDTAAGIGGFARPGGGSGGGRRRRIIIGEDGVLLASLAGGAGSGDEEMGPHNNSDTLQKILEHVRSMDEEDRGEEAPRNNFDGIIEAIRGIAAVLYGETSTNFVELLSQRTSLPPALRGGGKGRGMSPRQPALGDYLRRMNQGASGGADDTRSGRALTRDQEIQRKLQNGCVDKDLSDPYTLFNDLAMGKSERALRDAGIFNYDAKSDTFAVQSSITQRQAIIDEAVNIYADSLTGGSNELSNELARKISIHRYMPGNAAERIKEALQGHSRASQGRAFDVEAILKDPMHLDRGKTLSQKDRQHLADYIEFANDEQRLRLQNSINSTVDFDITSRGFVDRKVVGNRVRKAVAEINKSVRRGYGEHADLEYGSAKFDRKAYLSLVEVIPAWLQPLNREKAFLDERNGETLSPGETQGPLADLFRVLNELGIGLQKGAFTFGNLSSISNSAIVEKLQKWTREEMEKNPEVMKRDKATAWGSGFLAKKLLGPQNDFGMSDSSSLTAERRKTNAPGIFGEGRGLLESVLGMGVEALRYADGFMDMIRENTKKKI